jgi:hypothetical protein
MIYFKFVIKSWRPSCTKPSLQIGDILLHLQETQDTALSFTSKFPCKHTRSSVSTHCQLIKMFYVDLNLLSGGTDGGGSHFTQSFNTPFLWNFN